MTYFNFPEIPRSISYEVRTYMKGAGDTWNFIGQVTDDKGNPSFKTKKEANKAMCLAYDSASKRGAIHLRYNVIEHKTGSTNYLYLNYK